MHIITIVISLSILSSLLQSAERIEPSLACLDVATQIIIQQPTIHLTEVLQIKYPRMKKTLLTTQDEKIKGKTPTDRATIKILKGIKLKGESNKLKLKNLYISACEDNPFYAQWDKIESILRTYNAPNNKTDTKKMLAVTALYYGLLHQKYNGVKDLIEANPLSLHYFIESTPKEKTLTTLDNLAVIFHLKEWNFCLAHTLLYTTKVLLNESIIKEKAPSLKFDFCIDRARSCIVALGQSKHLHKNGDLITHLDKNIRKLFSYSQNNIVRGCYLNTMGTISNNIAFFLECVNLIVPEHKIIQNENTVNLKWKEAVIFYAADIGAAIVLDNHIKATEAMETVVSALGKLRENENEMLKIVDLSGLNNLMVNFYDYFLKVNKESTLRPRVIAAYLSFCKWIKKCKANIAITEKIPKKTNVLDTKNLLSVLQEKIKNITK